MKISAYDNFNDRKGVKITVAQALKRIRVGAVRDEIEAIRNCNSKEKRDALKKKLSAVTFSGTFKTRKDEDLIEHSGLMSLDFDKGSLKEIRRFLRNWEYTYAMWLSPSGIGYKALVKIKHKDKHREHFFALENDFKKEGFEIDKSCKNESRLCFESWDPNIYINEDSSVYSRYATQEFNNRTVTITEKQRESEPYKIFTSLKIWMANESEQFVSGNRNNFVMKIAGACCRFGISENDCANFIRSDYMAGDKSFSDREMIATVKSAYARNKGVFGSQAFENEKIVNSKTKVEEKLVIHDDDEPVKDIIRAKDKKRDIKTLYEEGYVGAETTHIPDLDKYWKWSRGEVNLFTGMGNCGKSEIVMELSLIKAFYAGNKFAVFGPEVESAMFFWSLIEKLLGQDCTPKQTVRPKFESVETAMEWLHEHFFFIEATEAATPEYVLGKFMELRLKHGVDCCILDPWNQMEHDYVSAGGRTDKYLEKNLPKFKRFTAKQQVHLIIVAHPKALVKKKGKPDYECPEVFDVNDGAMWNNQIYNICVIHRPYGQSDPGDSTVEFHSKKIKIQQKTGIRGTMTFNYDFSTRRYLYPFMRDENEEFDMDKHPLNSFSSAAIGEPLKKPAPVKMKNNEEFDREKKPKHTKVRNYYDPKDDDEDDYEFFKETGDDVPF